MRNNIYTEAIERHIIPRLSKDKSLELELILHKILPISDVFLPPKKGL